MLYTKTCVAAPRVLRAEASMARRQVHLWISDSDHAYLQGCARDTDEPLSAVLRRLIRSARRRAEAEKNGRTTAVERPGSDSVRHE